MFYSDARAVSRLTMRIFAADGLTQPGPATRLELRSMATTKAKGETPVETVNHVGVLTKSKCDALSKSCSRCKAAGLVCVGLDSVTRQAVPRSIVQYLENEIASYEKAGQSATPPDLAVATSARTPSTPSKCCTTDFPHYSIMNSVIHDFTPPFLGLSPTFPLAQFVVTGTRIPSTGQSFGLSDLRTIINLPSTSTPLSSIPIKIADFLFTNYVSRVLPSYPIFYEPDVRSMYNTAFHNPAHGFESGARSTSFEVYVLSLIMAISLSTAARTKQLRANSIALGLFKNAVQQLTSVYTNDFRGLQCLVLLFQYTFLNPSAANLWYLSGYASQACIDLGLHQEIPENSPEGALWDQAVDVLTTDLRRRLFWCVWEMDVAVSAGLLRPISILNKHIKVPFPSELEDRSINKSGINVAGRATKATAIRIWQFRQIESDIISVRFHNEPIPSSYSSSEEWSGMIETNILQWNSEIHRSAAENKYLTLDAQWAEMSLYADIATPYILITLFRPAPLEKNPSSENLMKAFIAAVKVANGYFQQANGEFGSIKYVFHPCHHVFSSATVFLHAMQRCKSTITSSFRLDEVEEFMSSFSRFFSTIAERWPAASRCLEEYERLLAPIKNEYIDYTLHRSLQAPVDSSDFQGIVGLQDDLMGSVPSLGDMAYFSALFDNAPDGFDAEELSGLYSGLPSDWNAEFDLGMHSRL